MFVHHHHCWKCANFPMFRASTYNGMYSMQIINMKNKCQHRCVQFFPFLVFHPNTCFSFPQGLPPCLYYMCMLCVPCPIALKVAISCQFEGRQRSICCMSWLLFLFWVFFFFLMPADNVDTNTLIFKQSGFMEEILTVWMSE